MVLEKRLNFSKADNERARSDSTSGRKRACRGRGGTRRRVSRVGADASTKAAKIFNQQ